MPSPSASASSDEPRPSSDGSPNDGSSNDGSSNDGTSADPSASTDASSASGDAEGALGWVARWPEPLQWGFAGLLLLGLLAGGLWGLDQATRSPLDRLAAIDVSETRIEGYRTTASQAVSAPDSASADRLFLRALVKLRASRTTTLGFFPRYRDPPLSVARALLQEVIDRAPADSFVGLEARFFLAKTELAREDVDAARQQLLVLARRDNRRAVEAVSLLRDLQAIAPTTLRDTLDSPYEDR